MKKVFILGNPRSGTSLFRLMLNAHPEIIAPPESGFLQWWSKKYSDWKWPESASRLEEFIRDLATSRKIETWHLDFKGLSQFIETEKPAAYAQLGELVYLFYARSTGKAPIILADKNNYYIHHLEELKAIWPDAYFIQLVRDGRDVACSYIEMKSISTDSVYKPKLVQDVAEIAREWIRNNNKIRHFISDFPKSQSKVLRFEDLVEKTEETLTEVCQFLNIPFHPAMLNYFKKENHDEPPETMAWKQRTLEPPDLDRLGRYKSFLTEKDIEVFNALAGDTLLQFNYSLK